jgi:hypothetical protein
MSQVGERCGCWIMFGTYETVCALPIAHVGRCLPYRSELMRISERLEQDAQSIYDAIIDQDARRTLEPWPHEGCPPAGAEEARA